MNERDVRLLFDAGHWSNAKVIRDPEENGWRVLLIANSDVHPTQILSSKRGSSRIFKTSDTALLWCKEIGFEDITIQFDSLAPSSLTNGSSTVLLVEDNPDDVLLTKRAFEMTNLNVVLDVACDGQDAVDYIFANGKHSNRDANCLPKLILLDINLPKLNGLEVLEKIRNHDHTKFVPVVLLTTSDEFCDVVEGYQLGSNSYIKKPVNFKVFSEVIQNLGEYWLHINTPPPILEKS